MKTQLKHLKIIFEVLHRIEENVILIFHPKTNLNFYKNLIKNYNFIISKKSYIDLIPISDIYLCGNSTTVSVAEICNIPIINLDFVNLNFSWIKSKKLRSVVNMNNLYLILKKEIYKIKKKKTNVSRLNKDYTINGRSRKNFINFLHKLI
jgi:hypothetical protein